MKNGKGCERKECSLFQGNVATFFVEQLQKGIKIFSTDTRYENRSRTAECNTKLLIAPFKSGSANSFRPERGQLQ
jgi:hypothetical protein